MSTEGTFVEALNGGWRARRASDVGHGGEVITSEGYEPADWLPAVVPGSVLATLVANGEQPDPYVGDASLSIPDASQAGGLAYYTFWFYRTFETSVRPASSRLYLRFDGINYAADVYLDGRKLEQTEREGMFQRRTFDITGIAEGKHRLAVLVCPPDPPGKPAANGGDCSASSMGANVTARYLAGWDGIVPMPDRSTGIWDKVSLIGTGPVTLGDPHVACQVEGPRLPVGPQAPAGLTVSVAVANTTDRPISGILECTVDDEFARADVALEPKETRRVSVHFKLHSPRLWWPNGMGEPYLHESALTFCVAGQVSARRTFNVGVRHVDAILTHIGERQARVFTINGQRVFLRGGDWIGTDAMFRHSANAKRYHDEVRMHASANLNFLHVWGGGIAERDSFYDACDAHGILVMQDFWLSDGYPEHTSERWAAVFQTSARDTIARLQHHPSLLAWCGGDARAPSPSATKRLTSWISGPDALDGTRPFVERSTDVCATSSRQDDDVPYATTAPAAILQPGLSPISATSASFGTPTYDSLCRSLSAPAMADFPRPGLPHEMRSAAWRLHGFTPPAIDNLEAAERIESYGSATSAKQFAYLAQLANYARYRALFEGFGARGFEGCAGAFVGQCQNPWPGLRDQLYDWYLEQTGSLFGSQHACEPVHIQLSLSDAQRRNIRVLVNNSTTQTLENVTATAQIYALDGTRTNAGCARKCLPATSVIPMFGLEQTPSSPGTVYFVDLSLTDAVGTQLSRNFYWLETDGTFRALDGLPPAHIEATATLLRDAGRWRANVMLANGPDQPVAFFLQLQVRDSGLGERVLPVFYEDNYVSLVPGERRELSLDFEASDVPSGTTPELWCCGWNVPKTHIFASL